MKKESLRNFVNSEFDALTGTIDNFRKLLPSETIDASKHNGEEGRFIELILTQYLRDKLPNGIWIGSGFVADLKHEWSSSQIDILLYDAVNYSPFVRYGDAVVIPAQSLVWAISVKRTLYYKDLKKEIQSLTKIGSMAGCAEPEKKPYLSLVAFGLEKNATISGAATRIFEEIKQAYDPSNTANKYSWNELIDSINVFDHLIVKGKDFSLQAMQEKTVKKSNYLWTGWDTRHRNIYIQHLLSWIYKAWYRREDVKFFVSFPRSAMQKLWDIEFCTLNRPSKP